MTTREGETMNADISETISRIARDGARPYQIRGVIMRLQNIRQSVLQAEYLNEIEAEKLAHQLDAEIAALEDV